MFDIGWTEITVILIIVIIVIGPKELPGVLRTVGIWVGKAKSMASEFRNQVDEMIEESELKEVRTQIESVSSVEPITKLETEIDPNGDLKDAFDFSGKEFENPISAVTDSSEVKEEKVSEDESQFKEDDSTIESLNEKLAEQAREKSEKDIQA